jgi:hypothetical protein
MASGADVPELANFFERRASVYWIGVTGELMFGGRCAGAGSVKISDIVKRPCAKQSRALRRAFLCSIVGLLLEFMPTSAPRIE